MSRRPHVAIINASTVLSDQDIAPVVDALQVQVNQHFAPAWGGGAKLSFVPKGGDPEPGSWWLVILDNSDQAGALGYHDLTKEGLPMGKAFAGTDIQYGYRWSVTLSHELLEILADPDINLSAQIGAQEFVAYEACDPVEADELGYEINGVLLSDFVTPAWFMRGYPGPYDQQDKCPKPLTLLKGGYISVWRPGTGWSQLTARKDDADLHATVRSLDHADELPLPPSGRAHVGSRRERRRTPRRHWNHSTA